LSKKHVIIIIALFFIGISSVAYCFGNDASGDELIDCDTTESQEISYSDEQNKKYDKSVKNNNNTTDNSTKSINKSESKIYIHICGEVREPGVYELKKKDARVIDAIKAAGGTTKEASIRAVNQAEKVTDGQQIYIPSKDEEKKDVISSQSSNSVNKIDNLSEGSSGELTKVAKKVNINTALEQELITLPGIGSAKAEKIINYRTAHGNFKKIEDIMKIPGIKEGLFNKISENITV
jgi:competence protein ComEA